MTSNEFLLTCEWQYQDLLISPLSSHDWPLFTALYCDAKIMRHICPVFTTEEAIAFFQNTMKTQQLRPIQRLWFAIKHNVSGVGLGICGIPSVDYAKAEAELGIMLLAEAQGKTTALHALTALVQQTTKALPIKKVFCRTNPENLAVGRLVEKLGFKLVPMGADGLQRWELDIKKLTTYSCDLEHYTDRSL